VVVVDEVDEVEEVEPVVLHPYILFSLLRSIVVRPFLLPKVLDGLSLAWIVGCPFLEKAYLL